MTFEGISKPKLEIGHVCRFILNGYDIQGYPKPKLEIGHWSGIQQSSSQDITFEGI